MEREFCRFLNKIGMIDIETSSTFLKIYNDIYQEENDMNIFELSFQILITFLNNITNAQKNYMCHNLPLKFYEINEKHKKDKLTSIIMKNKLKNKINLLKYLYTWKNNKRGIINEKRNKIKKGINSFNKNNSFIQTNMNNSKSNTMYKIPNKKFISNHYNIKDKYKYIYYQDDFSNDNNLSKNSNPQLFLSNTYKNNNKGVKINHNSINGITNINNNYKDLNKSSSGNKSLNTKKQKKNLKNSASMYDMNTTWGHKEQLELKECTFKPKINDLKRNITTSKITFNKYRDKEHQSRFDKLYNDNEKYILSKQIKAIQFDHMITKDLTFNPNINNKTTLSKEGRKDKFENRIKTYLEIKNKRSDEIQNKINQKFEENYSFTPKINNSTITKINNNSSIFNKTINNEKYESQNMSPMPVYLRLFEESKLRKRKQNQRKKELDNYINNLSNSHSKKSQVVNFRKINELYENKNKSKINEKTKNKVENEEGITFKPYIFKNRFAKNVNSTFYERNSKFLDDKEKFINLHQNKQSPIRNISPKDKKGIVKNIIDRLYNDSRTGSINNSIGCNKYIKSIQGSFTNKHNYDNKINNNNYIDYNSLE